MNLQVQPPSVFERLKHALSRPRAWLRSKIRRLLFSTLDKWISTDEGRESVADAVRGLSAARLCISSEAFRSPYPDLAAQAAVTTGSSVPPIFITARFRSGSTLLWNIFRHIPQCTAYYEPLNERRWFDATRRQAHVDATHLHVDDYWREYDHLPQLVNSFRDAWNWRHFYMDADYPDPQLHRYISTLIEGAPGRPVLQFNRIDFRLPWIRRHFPAAFILHLYRHPRDQWTSMLLDDRDFPRELTPTAFEPHDKFYLLRWSRDLRYRFPFLDERSLTHPYQLSYLIWKLSYAFGQTYANKSISFESLTASPDQVLRELLSATGIETYDLARLSTLVEPARSGGWRLYADDAWFAKQEAHCDAILDEYFCAPRTPQ